MRIYGILVHGLPSNCWKEALDNFSTLSVKKHTRDKLGLSVYFEHYDCVRKAILKKTLEVRRESYNIYPLVTNLTIQGIGRYANEQQIFSFVKPYGRVLKLYAVEENYNYELYKSFLTMDDYRIVLDVPEVLFKYHLEPIVLPEIEREFPVLFFCRLCRQDGHKQYQCPIINNPQPLMNTNFDSFEQNYCFQSGASEKMAPLRYDIPVSPSFLPTIPSSAISSVTHCSFPDHCDSSRGNCTDTPTCHLKRNCTLNFSESSESNIYHSDRYNNTDHKRNYSSRQHNIHLVKDHQQIHDILRNEKPAFPKSSSARSFQIHPQKDCIRNYQNLGESTSSLAHPVGHRLGKQVATAEEISSKKLQKSLKNEVYFLSKCPTDPNKIKNWKNPRTEGLGKDRKHRGRCKMNSTKSMFLDKRGKITCRVSVGVEEKCFSSRTANCSHKAYKAVSSQLRDTSRRNTTCSTKRRPPEKSEKEHASRTANSSLVNTDSTSMESNGLVSKKKKREGIRLSLLTPPSVEPEQVLKLIRHTYDAQTMPQEAQKYLEALLEWIKSPNRPALGEKETTVVQNLRHYLEQVYNNRTEKEDRKPPEVSQKPKAESESQEGRTACSVSGKKIRRRRSTISEGILDILKEVHGELSPTKLENFLKQVRGRKKQIAVASHFTSNISSLISQLTEVMRTYYISGRRGSAEDIDIRFIRDLSLRLQRGISEMNNPLHRPLDLTAKEKTVQSHLGS